MDIFLTRLKELRGAKSQVETAHEIGITAQTLGRYEKGERKPDIEVLKMLAEYYQVSTDYLLGLSDVHSVDADIQTACKVTGLSEEAIVNLKEIQKTRFNDNFEDLKRSDIINTCISHPMFKALIDSIVEMIRISDSYKISFITNDPDIQSEINSHWTKEFILSKYLTDEIFKHFCDSLIEDITELSAKDLHNETIIDLRYFGKELKNNGKHHTEKE